MKIIEYIDEYAKKKKISSPIFSDEIYNYVKERIPNLEKNIFILNLNRYEKRNENFKRYQKGIYYKSSKTPFGYTAIDQIELLIKQYMEDNGEIIGYESGPSFMNKIGLTTQMPSYLYIATSIARYKVKDNDKKVIFIKPVIKVNKNNYKYLQFLDILENKEKVKIENKDYLNVLKRLIKKEKLSFEKLIGYARFYNNNSIYNKLAELAEGTI